MRKWILTAVLAAFAAVAWALPSLQDVEAEVQAGRFAQAETMMREVVAAKPGSARAHYVYAEILAHQGKIAQAAEEAQKARVIDPDVRFTNDPEKFRSFEAALQQQQRQATRPAQDARRAQAAAPAAPAAPSTGIPSWVWLVGLVVVGVLLWRAFTRSRNAAVGGGMAPGAGYGVPGQPGAPGAYGPGGYGPGAVPPGYAPQRSSMLGTGLAAAGGVAAGMLASEMLHRRSEHNLDDGSAGQPGYLDAPDGGNALEDRPIDFGGGGDWDSGGGGDAGGGGDGGWD